MSKSQKYWKKRIQQQEHNTDKINENYLNGIDKYLNRYKSDLKKEIESFYSRYANDYKMTMADAKKLLTDDEVKEFKNSTLARYRELVLDPNTPPQLIDALSYRHRISRKDALIAEIERLTVELYGGKDGIQESVNDCLDKVYKKASIDIAKGFQLAGKDARPILNNDVVKQKLNANWSGKTFSQAVWGHEKEYMKKIEKTLNHGFMQGHGVDKMIKALDDVTNVPRYRVKALIYTESTYFANLANMDQMKAVDAKRYEIMAVRDNRTSEKCKHEDGKVYDLDKFEPGKTAPPFHVHCRSSIIPSLTEEEEKLFEEPEEEEKEKKQLEKEHDRLEKQVKKIDEELKAIEEKGNNIPGTLKNMPKLEKLGEQYNALEEQKRALLKKQKEIKAEIKKLEIVKAPSAKEIIKKIEKATKIDEQLELKNIKSQLAPKEFDELKELIENNPHPGVKEMYAKYANEIKVKKVKKRGEYNGYYKTLEFSIPKHKEKNPLSTFAHEFGHAFDDVATFKGLHHKEIDALRAVEFETTQGIYNLSEINNNMLTKSVWDGSSSDEFLTAFRKDKAILLSKEKELQKKAYDRTLFSGVQDIADGIGVGRMRFRHSETYYSRYYKSIITKEAYVKDKKTRAFSFVKDVKKLRASIGQVYKELGLIDKPTARNVNSVMYDYMLACEAWAHASDAALTGGIAEKSMLEYMPNTYKAYLEIIKGVQ